MEACSSPRQAEAYARAIVDHAKWRAFDEGLRKVRARLDAANADTIGDVLPDVLDTFDREVIRQGARTTAKATGRRDLAWVLDGTPPDVPAPVYGRRDDDTRLFYAGRVNGVYGDPETAKTWLAMMCACEAFEADQSVAYIDVDHNGQQLTVEKLLLLGARPDHIGDPARFRYYEPDDGHELRAAIAEATIWSPAIAVLDSMGEMLPMLGVKSVDNDEITVALRAIANPLANTGACAIYIDHLPKNKEARESGYAIGGTAKKRAIDGSYIHAEVRSAPAPGDLGKIHLRIEKDRPGRLRQACNGKWIGTFVLDSRQPHVTTATIESSGVPTNEAGDMRPTHLMEDVSRCLEQAGQPLSGKNITDSIKGRPQTIREAVARLVEEGYITTYPGPQRAVLHQLAVVYRHEGDEVS